MHIAHCQRKTIYEDEYDKINEISNFECNLVSHINKLRDTVIKLGSRDPLFMTWNSALSSNGSLNIHFN